QGRVLDGDLITGWEKRQVFKEDNGNISQTEKSPAERKRAQRERERKREQNGDCHGASRNVTRGHIDVTTEDLASALDVTEEVIDSILQTMQGRVLDGDLITGWEKRQVLKEDNGNISQTAKSPAERKRAQRERE
ncbi:hypothetical protein, partial [Staphylococcus saprophyticus]|uniref:hypothetical protein n=1 Tax=Staphylococcus saprophyticus TaxID=29385 RepID=UPI0019D71B4E